MMNDRVINFFLAIALIVSMVTWSVPVDYEGVSPQEAFVVAMEESMTELGEALIELSGMTAYDLEAEIMEDMVELFGDDFATILADAEDMSISDQMLLMQYIMAEMLAELGMDIDFDAPPVASADDILAFLTVAPVFESIVNELMELLTEEVVLDMLDGWFTQLIIGLLLEDLAYDDIAELEKELLALELDFSLFAEMDYFFGEGTVYGLLGLDTNQRFVEMGELFGGFISEQLIAMIEMMNAIAALVDIDDTGFVAFDLDSFIHVETVYIDESKLEERFAFDVSANLVGIEIVESIDGANLNVFVINKGDADFQVYIETIHNDGRISTLVEVVVIPGAYFVTQIPADRLGEETIVIISDGTFGLVPVSVYAAFRFTEHPLQ